MKKYLLEITGEARQIAIEDVNIITNPLRSWKDGIRMVPALKIENRILSGVFLPRDIIADFIGHLNP